MLGTIRAGGRSRPGLATCTATLPALLAAGGCALVFQAPTVRVAEVRVGSLTFLGGAVIVRLEVDNPNRFALQAEAFRYGLSFRGHEALDTTWITLAESSLPDPVRFPARDTGSVDVEVPFQLSTLGGALERLLQRGELDYRFIGELRVGTPVGSRQVPIDERGVFSLLR
jgi:LEA14-like dessication related protein